jgi:hypothetical protein
MCQMAMLTRAEVDLLNARFGGLPTRLWHDIELLADRVHATYGDEQRLALHHLMLAVTNFKARLPIDPPPLPSPAVERAGAELVEVGDLHRDKPATWRALEQSTRGFGVPRSSALLAALWPRHHAVIDRRSLSVAFALA